MALLNELAQKCRVFASYIVDASDPREYRVFFDNSKGLKMAALSISEKKWLH